MRNQCCFTPEQCCSGPGSATSLREKNFRAIKQINSVAEQCCNFKKQCCSAIKQSITVRDRIVFATKKTVGVTRMTGAVRALPVSVAKKSINDALPVMSETEFIFTDRHGFPLLSSSVTRSVSLPPSTHKAIHARQTPAVHADGRGRSRPPACAEPINHGNPQKMRIPTAVT